MKQMKTLLTTFAVLGLSGAAFAGDRFAVDAEIDKLDARIRPAGTEWHVDAVFEVEVEANHLPQGLALVLQMEHAGGLLYTADNRPFEVVLPLDRPTEVDDDEFEFKGNLSFAIPTNQVTHHDALRLIGLVYPDPQSPALDRDDTRVKLARGIDGVQYTAPQTTVIDQRYITPAPQAVQPQQPVLEQQLAPTNVDPRYIEQLPAQPVPQPVVTQPTQVYAEPVAPVYAETVVAPAYPQAAFVQPVVAGPVVQPIVNVVNPRPALGFGLGFGHNYGFRNFCATPYRRTTIVRSSPLLRTGGRTFINSRNGLFGGNRTVINRSGLFGGNRTVINRGGLFGGNRTVINRSGLFGGNRTIINRGSRSGRVIRIKR